MAGNDDKQFLVRLPRRLHRQARQMALDQGRPLSEIVRELIEAEVSRQKNTEREDRNEMDNQGL
jgi:predicted DNA-binding protein